MVSRWSRSRAGLVSLVSYVQALGPAASNECGLLTVKVIAYTPLHHLCSTHYTIYRLVSCCLGLLQSGVSAIAGVLCPDSWCGVVLAAAAAQLFVGSRPEPAAHLQLQLSTLSTPGFLNLDIETTFICQIIILKYVPSPCWKWPPHLWFYTLRIY